MKLSEKNNTPSETYYTEHNVYQSELIEGLPVAIYRCDADGYVLVYNKAAVELWGRAPEIGKELWCGSWKIFKTDGTPLPLAECPMAIALKEGRIINPEIIIERPDGERRNIIPHPQPIYDTSGKLIGAVNTLIDITEQVKARKKIEDIEMRARLALDAAELGTFDWDLANQQFVSSPRLLAIFGFNDKPDATHQDLIDTFHPDDKAIRDKAVADSYSKGSLIYEARSIWKDRSIHWLRVYGKIVHNEKQEPTRMYGTVMDVTEQKTSEETIKQSEERFRQIADMVPQIVWTMRTDGYVDYFNKQWYKYTGVEEGYGDENKFILIHPDDEQACRETFTSSLKSGEPFQIEFRLRNIPPPRTYRWFLARAVPVRDKEKKIIKWLGTSTDIDDQKKIATELEQKVKDHTVELNERNLFAQTLLDSSVDSIMVIDKNERVTSLNETAKKLFAPYFPDGIEGKSLEEIDPTTKSKPDWAYTSAALKGEFIYRKNVKSETEERYFDIYYIPLKKENEFCGTMLTIREVTESVFGRIALEKANSQLIEAQGLANIGSWEWNINDNKITWTDELYKIFGQTRDKFENNYENYLNIIHPDDREFVNQTVENALHSHKPYNLIHRLVWSDGSVRTVQSKGKVTLDDKKKPVRLSGTSQDITETVRIKSKLQQSEMRHHLMVEQIEDYAIIFLNTQGNIEDWNKGAEKIKGYSEAEIIGKNFSVFYTEEDQADRVPETILSEAKQSKKVIYEGWRVRKDGSKFWASVLITALTDETNNFIGFSKLTRDLTEQKINEEAIKEHSLKVTGQNIELEKINMELANQKAFAELLIESSPLMILAYDKNMNITTWNKKSEEHNKLKKEQVIGKHTFEIFHEYNNENWVNSIKEVMEEGKTLHYPKVQFKNQSGWGEIFVVPLRDTNNDIIGVLSITKEITELVKMTLDVEKKNEDLEKMNKELASFSYIASHDLQEPLRKIVTFSTRLQEKHRNELSDDVKLYLDRIESSSSRMTKLIQDLLNYSRLVNHEKLFEQTDLNGVLKNVLNDFELLIQEKYAQIKNDILPVIEAIPLQMNQLFYNLISNALKFSKQNVPPLISITSRRLSVKEINKHPELTIHKEAKVYYEIIFKDNGVGFEQKYGEQIFIIFQRLYAKSEYTGTGIGLTISKKMVENHNGIIFCEAKENEGAAFHIILPVNQQ